MHADRSELQKIMSNRIFKDAEWIFADCDATEIVDKYFEYRALFDQIAEPQYIQSAETKKEQEADKKTVLYISAYSQYAVYVNNRFVDCGQYDGYEDYQVYDTLDITPYLVDGRNEIRIGHYVCGSDFSTRQIQIPGIIFAVYDGDRCLLSSNRTCEARENRRFLENREIISKQLGYNFEYDENITEAEFSPCVLAEKEKMLYERPVKKLIIEPFQAADLCAQGLFKDMDAAKPKAERMQKAFLSASPRTDFELQEDKRVSWSVPEETNGDGVYMIFDLQKENAGLLQFEIEVPEKTEVLLGYGEHLDDLRVRCHINYRNFCFRYIAKPGKNYFFYPYQRIGLRYLQFHVYSGNGSVLAGIREQHYPLTRYMLPLKDGLHKRIYEVGCDTLDLCMHEHYEDCPWREQAQYAMDSRVQMLCGYYAFREYQLPRATLLLMLRSLQEDNLLALCAPGKITVNIPSFTAVFVRQVLEYIEYSGDTAFAAEVFEDTKKIADGFIARITDKNLIPLYCGKEYWNFYEWTKGLTGGERHYDTIVYESPLNAFVSDALRCFAEICKWVKPELTAYYMEIHERMNRAMHDTFFDENTGAYITRLGDEAPKHVLTQSLLLYVDAVPDMHKQKVLHVVTEGNLMTYSLSTSIYVFEALLKQGDRYKEYILREIEQVWSKMLAAGATTFWETAAGADAFDFAGSLCHGWSAVPVYIFGKYFTE